MNPETLTVRRVASRNYNVVDSATGEPVRDCEGNPVRYQSAGAAKAEIATSLADAAAEPVGDVAEVPQEAPEAVSAPVAAPAPLTASEAVLALSRVERIAALKAEVAALRAWEAAGSDPALRPDTPVHAFMDDPNRPKVTKQSGRATVSEADLRAAVVAALDAGAVGTHGVAAHVRASGVKVGGARMSAAITAVRKERKAVAAA